MWNLLRKRGVPIGEVLIISFLMAANTLSKQQVKSEVVSTLESDKILLVTQSVDDSDDNHKKQSNKDVQYVRKLECLSRIPAREIRLI